MDLKTQTGPDGKSRNSGFPVVAIGASAGGLEALEQFFRNVPNGCGMAFVVIQHLDPNYKGMMPELIQRVTNLKVLQVSDHLKVKPDTVYVIPPNRNMSILNGRLHLFDLVEEQGLRLPINFFFHSLADDLGEKGVGIILSGMGSDGSQGLQSVKERGGLTIVQEPSTAGYDSMPVNAIQAVRVDLVAPPGEMPGKIISILKNALLPVRDTETRQEDKTSLEKIVLLIRSKTGHDFSQYKKSTIYRRVERRMMIHKITRINSYIRFLQENPGETDILFKELLIGATSFFRDPELWQLLSKEVIPEFIRAKPDGYTLRLWIAGCSTGEEAYSYAIALRETIDSITPGRNISFQIFASDLDSGAIEKARKGVYNEGMAATVSADRLNRFFSKTGSYYKVKRDIREYVIFSGQNLINDPPFTKIDLISCRNVMIYLEQDLQRRLLSIFHYSLSENGLLILGTSESANSQTHLFVPVNARLRVLKKISPVKAGILEFPTKSKELKKAPKKVQPPMIPFDNIESLTDNLILQQYSPAGVLVNREGDIIYLTRRAGKYLEPAAGKANMNIFSMLREGLAQVLPAAFKEAAVSFEKIYINYAKIEPGNDSELVDVILQKLENPAPLKGLILIVFRDVILTGEMIKPGVNKKTNATIREREIHRLRDELQSLNEENQASEEELKSSNEELQSTNEELQSTNEELTTSKEEMQSINEELQTVNLELMSKVEDHTELSNDMRNLLESTEIATLFLTKDLRVRRFTTAMKKIFRLIDQDLGRPISDLSSELLYEDFKGDMKEVLRTLVFIEKQIITKSGTWFQVRIMPYRTTDDRIDGIVITFSDITFTKKLEAELNKTINVLKKDQS